MLNYWNLTGMYAVSYAGNNNSEKIAYNHDAKYKIYRAVARNFFFSLLDEA